MKYLDHLREGFYGLERKTRLRLGIGLAGLLLLTLVIMAIDSRVSLLIKKRQVREADLTEMLFLKQRYEEAKTGAQKLANRLAATT